jgi:hypothetical protein
MTRIGTGLLIFSERKAHSLTFDDNVERYGADRPDSHDALADLASGAKGSREMGRD